MADVDLDQWGLGCGDSACHFNPPQSGMMTNGGCRCAKNLPLHKLVALVARVRELEADGISLTARNWRLAWESAYAQVQEQQKIIHELAAPNADWVDRALAAERERDQLQARVRELEQALETSQRELKERGVDIDTLHTHCDQLREELREARAQIESRNSVLSWYEDTIRVTHEIFGRQDEELREARESARAERAWRREEGIQRDEYAEDLARCRKALGEARRIIAAFVARDDCSPMTDPSLENYGTLRKRARALLTPPEEKPHV